MTTLLGINCAAFDSPAELARTGAKFVRAVYRQGPNWNIRPWVVELKAYGLDYLPVGDSSPDSLTRVEKNWRAVMTDARDRLGDLVKCWQFFNEPDGSGQASWTMTADQLNRGLAIAREVFPREAYTLVFPGLVSGQAGWLDSVNYWLCDAVAAHPYAKFVDSPTARAELDFMLNNYRNKGLPIWCTEYDSRTRGMATYLRDFPGVERAAAMCWSSAQTAGEGLNLGLLQNPTAMADFVAAAGGPVAVTPTPAPPVKPPVSPPVAPWPYYVAEGLAAAIRARGEVPIGPETYLAGGYSVAPTEQAEYKWVAASRSVMRTPWTREA